MHVYDKLVNCSIKNTDDSECSVLQVNIEATVLAIMPNSATNSQGEYSLTS